MELDQIKNICDENIMCHKCPLFDDDYYQCMLVSSPANWELEEIERRLKNYGEKEN